MRNLPVKGGEESFGGRLVIVGKIPTRRAFPPAEINLSGMSRIGMKEAKERSFLH
jgi:hypothetical protein|tara:strand:- start:234 stop:398 length:165 start_codon:yes stop_codon:yes gene_type:complete